MCSPRKVVTSQPVKQAQIATMNEEMPLRVIAKIRNDFPTKFGVPRQSGLASTLKASIVFEPEFRNADALRGLQKFSHIWLIWEFSEAKRESWSPTVRPPRLGGNTRLGVFATRSPFRPNAIGLSAVKLEAIEVDGNNGTILRVSGADLMDGTPILDIKPYLPSADCINTATDQFATSTVKHTLKVEFPAQMQDLLSDEQKESLHDVLAQDPRPAYHDDASRVYGFLFAQYEVKFNVDGDTLKVKSITVKQ